MLVAVPDVDGLAQDGRRVQDSNRLEGAEGLDGVGEQIVVEADLLALRAAGQRDRRDHGAAALELPGQGELRQADLPLLREVGVEGDVDRAAAPGDRVQIRDRDAVIARIAGLPAPDARQRHTGQTFLARLDGLLLALGDPERNAGIGEHRLVEECRHVEPIRLPGRRPVALALIVGLVELDAGVGRRVAVHRGVGNDVPRAGPIAQEVPHRLRGRGIDPRTRDRLVAQARAAELVAVRLEERHQRPRRARYWASRP
jgi:hypothetical protein